MKKTFRKKVFLGVFTLIIAGAIAFPFVSVNAGRDSLFVDKNASGNQDGSHSHPFKTISQAMNKADDSTDVFVADGEYKENVTVKKGVRLYGSGKDKTIIEADDDDYSVVEMKDKSRIEKVTLKGGRLGIYVDKNDKADIFNVIIKDNDKEGVFIDSGDTDNRHNVSIKKSVIKDNGGSGVYAEKRQVTIVDSTIQDNDGNGVFLRKDVTAWMENNTIKENKKSGIVAVLDKSQIGLKKNSIYRNGREGIEVNAYAVDGKFFVDKCKIYENGRYGIVRVLRGNASVSLWRGLSVTANTQYWGNGSGNVSGVIRVK